MRRRCSKGVCVMKKMEPIPAQDRPKLIAVVIGIGVALTFVVRSLGGTPIQAQSGGSEAAASKAAPLAVVNSLPPSALPSGDATTAAEPAGAEPDFGAPEGLPLSDPFHPIKGDCVEGPVP